MVRPADEARAADHVLDRRAVLRIGGLSAVGAALLAACGVGGGAGEDEGAAATTTTTTPAKSDITIVQTATTLEAVAVAVYERIIAAGLLTTPAVAEAAEAFLAHHTEHQSLFAGETSKMEGEVATGTNATLEDRIDAQLATMANEDDALRVVLDLERVLAATYQASASAAEDSRLRVPIMSVGGVEARHVSLIAATVGEPPYPADGLQTDDGAISTR